MPDLTASPGRAPHPGPGHMQSNNQQQNSQNMQRMGGVKEPVMLQGDFRKVSGISSEIFRQIEAVENDHDPSTAAALDVMLFRLQREVSSIFNALSFFLSGRRATRRDDCQGIRAEMYWKSTIL